MPEVMRGDARKKAKMSKEQWEEEEDEKINNFQVDNEYLDKQNKLMEEMTKDGNDPFQNI